MGTQLEQATRALKQKRALSSAAAWSTEKRALCAELRQRIASVTEYRDGLIAKRDRKAEQIPLRPHEERMWQGKIDLANESLASMNAELSALGW